MARAEVPAAFSEIRNPQSIQSHAAALRALKHEIIGHEPRKELIIRHGIIPLLKRNLALPDTHTKEHDELRLQTVQIVTCLAHGGLAFVEPLLRSDIIAPIIRQLSLNTTCSRQVVESLRAISAIADSLATDVLLAPDTSSLGQLSNFLFDRPQVDTFAEILAQRKSSAAIDEQIKLVLKIIATCLRDDDRGMHQATLVKTGILDYICSRLASMAYLSGHASPNMDSSTIKSFLPFLPDSSLQYIFEALACLCHKSAYRSMRIIYSRHLLAAFPVVSPQQHALGDYLSFADHATQEGSVDSYLPKLQAVLSKNEHNFHKAFPALGSFSSSEIPATISEAQLAVSTRTISADEFGSPLIAWLMHVARHTTGLLRLAALEFLAKLISALDQKIMDSWTESSRNRDRTLAFLVVPLLLRVFDEADPRIIAPRSDMEEVRKFRLVRERVPSILATLISDASSLQRAAHDANAISSFSKALKQSFDAMPAIRKTMWSATPPSVKMDMDADDADSTQYTLGAPSMTEPNIHRLRCRAASMEGLAAIAASDDNYKKMILDAGVTTCVMESLVPYPDGPLSSTGADPTAGKDGNPAFVVIAACKLVTALSRCVGVLRTKLLDAGVAKPVLALLTERDYRLKSAGLDAATNLLLHFSPMRQELVDNGVIKTICSHAHSADPELRLSALWALKNLCASAPKDVRFQIVEELGTGWLIQIMSGETSSSRPHMATPNAAGEQVDLLNADDDATMDLDEDEMDYTSDEDDEAEEDERRQDEAAVSLLGVPSRHQARLRAIRREEESPVLKARRSDIRIQTKVIDLVRNVVCEAGPDQPGTIDNVLQSFGSSRLFEVLAAKLKPHPTRVGGKTTHSFSPPTAMPAGKRPTLTTPAAASNSREDKEAANHIARIDTFPTHQYPPAEIIVNTIFTLIHIANGRPTHRLMLLNLTTPLTAQQAPATLFPSTFPSHLLPKAPQTKLLDLLLPLFWHPDPRIRTACCWMVHNILWMEDQSDAASARQRAIELRHRGFEEAVRSCALDEYLDVKERAKGNLAMWEGGSSNMGGNGGGNGGDSAGRDFYQRARERDRARVREQELRDEVEGRGSEAWRSGR